MRRTACFVIIVMLCGVFPNKAPAADQLNQGRFALALAQVLGFEERLVPGAGERLDEIRIFPNGGWRFEEPLTCEIVRQIQNAVVRAMEQGRLKPDQAKDAVDLAAASQSWNGEVVTQGQFALELTRVMGFEENTETRARDRLEAVRVEPHDGWRVNDLLTCEIVRQVENAVIRAFNAGLLNAVQTKGAVEAAIIAVCFRCREDEYHTGRATIVPWYAPVAGPPAIPVYRPIEASPFQPALKAKVVDEEKGR